MNKKRRNIKVQLELYAEAARKRAERPTSAANGGGGQPSTHDNKSPSESIY